jgi:hypothetical protein
VAKSISDLFVWYSLYQSPFGCRLTPRVRLRIMNRPAGFSAIAAANAVVLRGD